MADPCRDCVLRERARGYSLQQIGEICGCSVRRVRRVLQQDGDPLRAKLGGSSG